MKIVITDGIRSDASIIRSNLDDFSLKKAQLKSILDTVPNAWKGTDATSFINKYNEALTKLTEFEKSFNEYYTYLSKVKGVFDTLDEVYDRKI